MKHWIGVVSRDHVLSAVQDGFCQFNHGKQSAAQRFTRGDVLFFYSPRTSMAGGEVLQSFTAQGVIGDDAPYQVEQTADFHPFRRKVHYLKTKEAPIQPLLENLSFSKGKRNWGLVLRRGLFEIEEQDSLMIAAAMAL